MSGKPSEENPAHVTLAECHRTTKAMKGELKTIRVALVGEGLGGAGLVQDVSDLKKDMADVKKARSTAAEILKAIIAPIIAALVTAWVISGMPH